MREQQHDRGAADGGAGGLAAAIAINVGLTLAQIIGGLLAGSLSLVADALHNLTTLIVVGLFLMYEAIQRYFEQQTIDGWIVVIVGEQRRPHIDDQRDPGTMFLTLSFR